MSNYCPICGTIHNAEPTRATVMLVMRPCDTCTNAMIDAAETPAGRRTPTDRAALQRWDYCIAKADVTFTRAS